MFAIFLIDCNRFDIGNGHQQNKFFTQRKQGGVRPIGNAGRSNGIHYMAVFYHQIPVAVFILSTSIQGVGFSIDRIGNGCLGIFQAICFQFFIGGGELYNSVSCYCAQGLLQCTDFRIIAAAHIRGRNAIGRHIGRTDLVFNG